MPKNIVICSDGTGNTAIKGRGTNVFKLYEAIDLHGHKNDTSLMPQVAFYDDGVGTEKFVPLKLLGGAFGWGLSRNVKQLYADLSRIYQPGDHIFLFGFSRGAFTVRTLAGLIDDCGVLDWGKISTDDDLQKAVDRAYAAHREKYRKRISQMLEWIKLRQPYDREQVRALRRKQAVLREDFAKDGKVPIAFVGVWDTVDAVGLPFDELAWFINNFVYQFKFPDLKLSPIVRRACHALSIDEARQSFKPVMWDEKDETNGRIEQVWFAGVHSNVGGGYPKQGVSLVALDWMMSQAEARGLRFLAEDRKFVREHQNVHDHLYNSRSGLAMYYRYKPRDIFEICKKYGVTPKIHVTTFARITQATQGYAPGNLPMSQIAVVGASATQAASVGQLLSNQQSLLHRVRGWVWLRRLNHYVFLLLTLAFAVTYLWIDGQYSAMGMIKKACSLALNGSIGEVAKNLFSRPFLPALLLALLAACFCGLSLLPRRWMGKVFSRFWHGLMNVLRGLFGPQETRNAIL